MFSSKSIYWETPDYVFQYAEIMYGKFELDVCANSENKKCDIFYSEDDDGLKQNWSGLCWMNPPYGKDIGLWVRKAYEESLNRCTVVCLLPVRTCTKWWHEYVIKADVLFLRGRLHFNGHKNPAPFSSAIVVFKQKQVGGV